MFNVFKVWVNAEKDPPEAAKAWQEHENLIQNPQQIVAILNLINLHLRDGPIPLRLMIRDTDHGELVTTFRPDANKAVIRCRIEIEHHFEPDEELTFIAGWEGKLIAFSAFIIQSHTIREFTVSWPQVMVKSIGRDTYRVHPHFELPLSIELANVHMSGHLIDLSEGGMACHLSTADAQSLINAGQLVNANIRVGPLQFRVALMTICSEVRTHHGNYTRLGISFKGISNNDLVCIRRSLLGWQH
nr:PilZ domain-containing protein [uncultured Deefgea sp.]